MDDDSTADEALIQFLYSAPIGLLQATPDGQITLINPMSAQLLMPLAPDGALDNLFDLLQPLAPGLRAMVAARSEPGAVVCEALRLPMGPLLPDQPARTLALRLTRLSSALLMGCLSDVTHTVQQEQQRLESHLRRADRTDTLTGLPNRAVVRERVAQAIARQRADTAANFMLLCINVDRFDQVNLRHGAAVGDTVLRQMAKRLNAAVRPGDAVGRAVPAASTAARVGGDEFVLVIDGPRRAADVHGIAQRVVDTLSRPYNADGHLLHLAVSLGVVVGDAVGDLVGDAVGDAAGDAAGDAVGDAAGDPAPASADAPPDDPLALQADVLLQDATVAMREAKSAGGARFAVFDPLMMVRAIRRGTIEAELRRALTDSELFVVYQPIVPLAGPHAGTGDGNSVEALVRWQHPQRGTVPPLHFIEVAEQTGLIVALGAFVLEAACRQFMRWRKTLGAAAPQSLSVNLSRAQLVDASLVQQVQQTLAACGMPAACLQLEVTESLAAQDDAVRGHLHALKALGLTLALDDFGTGYSSLSSLQQLPVDVVKIDRSFVSQIETSAHHRVLVEATVRVASSLGMRTVAEGIETAGQAALLAELHCDKGQGYWFGRPMSADALSVWLLQRLATASLKRA